MFVVYLLAHMYNPFVELKKSWNILVATSTLWGNRADVPPVVYGNVDLKEDKQMKKLEEMETQIAALKDQIKTLEGNEEFYKSTTRNWQNTSHRKDEEIKELKNQLHSAGMDHAKAEIRVKELVRELNNEKKGAMDMISSLMAQVRRLIELNRDLNEEIKKGRIIKVDPPVVKNDNINYNNDWQLVHAAEKLIKSAKGKAGNSDQVDDIYDLKAKVAVARNYAAGIMDDKYIPSNLKDSIKAIMATINNWLI
jgi:DNA repair exonuclease SbcCD ATPase subunit